MKNQTKAWNTSKTHWKQSQLEVAVSAAFEYVQQSRPKRVSEKSPAQPLAAAKMQITSKTPSTILGVKKGYLEAHI